MSFQELISSIDENKKNTEIVESFDTKVTSNEEESEKIIDLSKFSQQDLQKLDKIKKEIDLSKNNQIAYYGGEIQKNIATFADGILEGVKTKDTGVIGENLSILLTSINGLDLEKLQEKDSFFRKIPLIKNIMNSVSTAKIKLENITETVDRVVVSLDTARSELIRDINILDSLYNKNLEYYHELELYIAAGELKHKELKETVLIELKNKADQSQDMLYIQKYNDFVQALNEIEKRVYDLKISREIAIQTMPQIRLIQTNDKILANKIQSSILTTIPIWKNQIALTISLNKQKTALELQKKVSDTTEDLLKRNAELLKTNSIEIAKESERGIISIETLRETHTKLLETIEESMKIYDEGRKKRLNVEKELATLENTQKQKLLSMKSK